jgi:rRNA-processing protein FCF1
MADSTHTKGVAAGIAALAICEALLLTLTDLKIMSVKQVRDVVDDAAIVHRDAVVVTPDAALRREVRAHFKRVKSSLQAVSTT